MMQKCSTNFTDFMQLFKVLMDRLDATGMELFLIQAWTVWNQRNVLEHGDSFYLGLFGSPRCVGWKFNRDAEMFH